MFQQDLGFRRGANDFGRGRSRVRQTLLAASSVAVLALIVAIPSSARAACPTPATNGGGAGGAGGGTGGGAGGFGQGAPAANYPIVCSQGNSSATGGGGGGGGAAPTGSGSISGGAGGTGDVPADDGGTGGGGGAHGVVVTTSQSIDGASGTTPAAPAAVTGLGGGGGGGGGGHGAVINAANLTLTNIGAIEGAAGGQGGASAGGYGGDGGNGGPGVSINDNNDKFTNNGSVTGGSGGLGGAGLLGSGATGSAGAGVTVGGSSSTGVTGVVIDNNGSISGGASPSLQPALKIVNGSQATLTMGASATLTNAIVVDGQLTFLQSANNATFGNTIKDPTSGGSGAIVVDTSNGYAVTLSGTNSYTGGTTVTEGKLIVGNSSALGATTGGVTLGSGSTLGFQGSSLSVANAISGAGAVTVNDAGWTVTLSGANSYTGATTVSGGTLAANAASAFSASSTTTVNAGGALDLGGFAQTINNPVALAGGTIQNGDLTGSIASSGGTVNGISGSASLTANGGTTTLQGSNTYTGATTINGGTLYGGDYSATQWNTFSANSATTVNSGGILNVGVNEQTINNVTLNGGTITLATSGGTYGTLKGSVTSYGGTFSAALIGASSFTNVSGTTYFSSAMGALDYIGYNSYVGPTTISGGTIKATGAYLLGDRSAFTIDANATLDLGGYSQIIGTLSGAGTVTSTGSGSTSPVYVYLYGAGTTTFSGQIEDGDSPVGLVVRSGLALTLSGTNAYTGATTVNGGKLTAGAANAFSANSATTVNSGGILDLGQNSQAIATVALNGGTLTNEFLNTGEGQFGTLTGAVTSSGGTIEAFLTGTSTVTVNSGTTIVQLSPSALTCNCALGGRNDYAGATTINAGGVLTTPNWSYILSENSAFTINSGGTLDLAGNNQGVGSIAGAGVITSTGGSAKLQIYNSSTFAGQITGQLGLDLASYSTETLTLTGTNNTFSGGITWGQNQTVNATNAGSLGTGELDMYPGSTLAFTGTGYSVVNNVVFMQNEDPTIDSGSGVITMTGVISGDGSLTKIGAGTLILTGSNTWAGGTVVDAGTLGVGANGALGSGSLMLNYGTTLQFEANGLNIPNAITLNDAVPTIDTGSFTDTLSGVISGAGDLTKIGSGTLILAGADTYTGPTDVQAGTLAVTGTIVSTATVKSGAAIGGSGTIGGLVVNSGGTVAPGVLAPFSTLNVAGTASFASGSYFAVNINPAGQNDKLVTTGATTISGGTVAVTAASGTYTTANKYTLVTATGGVTGTFGAVTGLASLAFLTPVLSYDPDDVYLGFTRKIVPPGPTPTPLFATVAQTPNQIATATALSAQPAGSPLYDAIIGQTAPGALTAFNALSGEIHASAAGATLDNSRLPREAVLDRLAEDYGAAAGAGGKTVKTYEVSTPAAKYSAWGQAFEFAGPSRRRRQRGHGLQHPRRLHPRGGRDPVGQISPRRRRRLHECEPRGSGAQLVGRRQRDLCRSLRWLQRGCAATARGAFYAYDRYGLNREASFPGFNEALWSGYGGDTVQAFGEAGWRVAVPAPHLAASWIEPFVGVTGVSLHTDAYAETPGPAALVGRSQSYGYGITTLGFRAETSLLAWAPLTLNGMVGWQHVYGGYAPTSALAFAANPLVPFSVAGAPIARNALALEIGADWRLTVNCKLGVYYSGLLSSSASDNAIKAKLEANF